MSVNLIELLSKEQGIDNLPKVDPNTQDIGPDQKTTTNLLLQAVIPSVLAGFYQYSRNEENADKILTSTPQHIWSDALFGLEKNVLIGQLADYAGATSAEIAAKMEIIADRSTDLLKSNASPATAAGIKNLLTGQRSNILQHLPGSIGLGKALHDTTLDDRTNKMEGPVSSLMHAIEKKFASTEIANEKKF